MIKYGLISEVDVSTLERTIKLTLDKFKTDIIHVIEIGVYGGDTGKGVKDYIESHGRQSYITGIDNQRDGEKLRYAYDKFILGDSSKVDSQIRNNSQHIIIFDGCHCLGCVIEDYNRYKQKVKIGGYLLFHDSASHIEEYKDYQHGDKNNPNSYISVRKALLKIGLLADKSENITPFKKVFDDGDVNNPAGGFAVFTRI